MKAIRARARRTEWTTEDMKRVKPANDLFDKLIDKFRLKNDAGLSRFLDLTPPHICKIRYGRLSVSGDTIIRIHEFTGMAVKDIKTALGLPIATREAK